MSKINYVLSDLDKEKGFNDELSRLLVNDIENASKIVFIASDFEDYVKVDKYVKIITEQFNQIGIYFKEINVIDKRVNMIDAVGFINNTDVIFLMGGDTLKQIAFIREYGLIDYLLKREGITIGVSVGAINMCKHVVLAKDIDDNILSTVCYDGIGLTKINIEPHFDFINIKHNKDIFEASVSGKIVCLPNDSFIRIEDGIEEYYGLHYVVADSNLEHLPHPYEEIKHLGTITLETERLILRKAEANDVEEFFYIQLDPELRRYMGPTRLGTNIDREKYYFSKILENYKEPNFYRWTIILKETNQILGTVMLNMHDEKARIAGIDYYLRRDQWNKGYMSEAAKRVLDFGFLELDLYRIESSGSKNNPGTYKVMEKMGLKHEGVRKQGLFYYYGGIQDLVLYGLTREEYEKDNKK